MSNEETNMQKKFNKNEDQHVKSMMVRLNNNVNKNFFFFVTALVIIELNFFFFFYFCPKSVKEKIEKIFQPPINLINVVDEQSYQENNNKFKITYVDGKSNEDTPSAKSFREMFNFFKEREKKKCPDNFSNFERKKITIDHQANKLKIVEANNTSSLLVKIVDDEKSSNVVETSCSSNGINNNKEEDDKLTNLTSYEEQLLDECIRKGMAKWTRQTMNEISPFSWDVGLTCLATKAQLSNKIRIHSVEILSKIKDSTKNDKTVIDNDNKETENSNYSSYEEQLLDQCIRRGIAKMTKKSINEIRPFSWDTNQICLTTKAMMLALAYVPS